MSGIDRIVVAQDSEHEEPWVIDAAIQLASETEAEIVVAGRGRRREPAVRDSSPQRAGLVGQRARDGGAGAPGRRRGAGPSAGPLGAGEQRSIEVAAEEDADLIVVGGGQRPALVERLLGSVPLELIQHAGRQVLVVTPPAA